MNTLKFGSVSRIYFKDEFGKTVRSKQRLFETLQSISNDSAEHQQPFDAFYTEQGNPPVCQGGQCILQKGKHTFYWVENGPNDTDGDDFKKKAYAINSKWSEIYKGSGNQLSTEQRQALIAEKTALCAEYSEKVTHRINVTLHEDGHYTRKEATILPKSRKLTFKLP